MMRSVGSVFKYNGRAYVVVENKSDAWEDGCGACAFCDSGCNGHRGFAGNCSCGLRVDNKSVHFEKKGGRK